MLKLVFMNFNETMTTDSLLPIIHEHRSWTIICSSHHAVQLATITNYSKFDLSSVRIIKPFGAAIYTDIADQLKKRFPSILPTLQCNYGMTEMAVISISTSPKVLGSLLPGCEVKVLGDNGKFLGPHQIGEILAKTPTMMKAQIREQMLVPDLYVFTLKFHSNFSLGNVH